MPSTQSSALHQPNVNISGINRLDLRQQRILAEVIDAASAKPGGHVITGRNGWSYWARHWRGRTRWIVRDCNKQLIMKGECS